jgi:Tol biopolymer transport system component
MTGDYRSGDGIVESINKFPWLYKLTDSDISSYGIEFAEPEITGVADITRLIASFEQVGGIFVSRDGKSIYFHALTGNGDTDIWMMSMVDGQWQEPENVANVNTLNDERYPFITFDGREMWFTGDHEGKPAIFRSMFIGREWQQASPIITGYALAPSLDRERNIYFTHWYMVDGERIDSDIYVAYRQKGCG